MRDDASLSSFVEAHMASVSKQRIATLVRYARFAGLECDALDVEVALRDGCYEKLARGWWHVVREAVDA